MKRNIIPAICLALTLACSGHALALEVPTDTQVRNLDGVQQMVKTYTLSPEEDPEKLAEEPFTYEGYLYSYASMVKKENRVEERREQVEVVTAETEKEDLSAVLETLSPTLAYEDEHFSGTLYLDHTTLCTEPAGYRSGSYTLTATREIDNLDSNDMAYIPQTVDKNGVTLPLSGVEWQVQGSALVDGLLMPSSYKAIATYSGKASYNRATGYITTAQYRGMVSRDEVESVTYTVTYTGKPVEEEKKLLAGPAPWSAQVTEVPWGPFIIVGVVIAVAAVLIRVWKRKPKLIPYDTVKEWVADLEVKPHGE